MTRLDELWKSVDGPGTPPRVDSGSVKARVSAALDAGHSERRWHMKKKLYTALVIAAVILAITGTAVAATTHWDALSVWFQGDKSPGQEYLDSGVYTVSDDNYTLTVESSAADENSIYLVVSVTALSEETKAFLYSDAFTSIDTWHAWSSEFETGDYDGPPTVHGWTSRELESGEENCRRFALDVGTASTIDTLYFRCGYMEQGKRTEIPVAPAPSVTVKINAAGTGTLELYPASVLSSDQLTIKEVTLTPFTCRMTLKRDDHRIEPRIFLRMKDGAIRTQAQLMDSTSGSSDGSIYTTNYRFHEVQELDNIVSVIAFDMEYPLDGSDPIPVEHDSSLDPFIMPWMERLSEHGGYSLSARELTEKLGGTFRQDSDSGEAVCTYRGVEIVLRPGCTTALVNGETVEMREAPAMFDGALAAPQLVFEDAWGIDCTGLREEHVQNEDGTETTVWLGHYIVP